MRRNELGAERGEKYPSERGHDLSDGSEVIAQCEQARSHGAFEGSTRTAEIEEREGHGGVV